VYVVSSEIVSFISRPANASPLRVSATCPVKE